MIGKLSGILDRAAKDHIILDVSGVGYVVFCSPATLSAIGQKGDPVSLLIDTHVREDHIHLYGFKGEAEQHWFRLLTSVQGVGAKAGMAILGICPPEQLGFAIASGDKAVITRADGIGPKIATRIITELKDKAGKLDFTPTDSVAGSPVIPSSGEESSLDHDAVSALVNLGYGRSDAFMAVSKAKQKSNDNNNLQDLIKVALQELNG